MSLFKHAYILVLCICAPVSLLAQEGRRLITPEDFFEIKNVANPVISPDGDWVAYTIRQTSLEDDESETRIWMVSSDGEEVIPMTGVGSSASDPAWSPDGKSLVSGAINDGHVVRTWNADGTEKAVWRKEGNSYLALADRRAPALTSWRTDKRTNSYSCF